jgi:hypothetical protein
MTIYFVSGHMNIHADEFEKHYVPVLNAVVNEQKDATFKLGNATGVDTLALHHLLKELNVPSERIEVYVYNYYPNKQASEIERLKRLSVTVCSGFENVHERDAALTRDSNCDILWIRSAAENIARFGARYKVGHVSGTEKNKIRRQNRKIVKDAKKAKFV